MNRGDGTKSTLDRPIAKPAFPLPLAFSPSKRSELATRRQQDTSAFKRQRAYFYRKGSNGNSPVYDFVIRNENEVRSN